MKIQCIIGAATREMFYIDKHAKILLADSNIAPNITRISSLYRHTTSTRGEKKVMSIRVVSLRTNSLKEIPLSLRHVTRIYWFSKVPIGSHHPILFLQIM